LKKLRAKMDEARRREAEMFLFGTSSAPAPASRKRPIASPAGGVESARKKRRTSEPKAEPEPEVEPEHQTEADLYRPAVPYERMPEASNPKFLKVSLYEHQRKALRWMLDREKKIDEHGVQSLVRGGIFADDMGLGKTLVSISTIVTGLGHYADKKPPSLIIVPLSVVSNWEEQMSVHAPLVRFATFHGGARRKMKRPQFLDCDVVITTYGVVTSEANRKEESPLFTLKFARVILDEAHTIKNSHTKMAQACFALTTKRRWCLTGTPTQNGLDDLFSSFRFLRLKPLDERAEWNRALKGRDGGFGRVQKLMRTISLRRLKTDRVGPDKRPILSLPPVTYSVDKVEFSPKVAAVYRKIHAKVTKSLTEMVKGKPGKSMANVLWILLRLRQICCHKSLAGGQPSKDKVQRKIEFLRETGDQACPSCQKPTSQMRVLPCCHFYCSICVESKLNGECADCKKPFSADQVKSVEDMSKSESLAQKAVKSPSGKIKALLVKLKAIPADEKIVVFSQFTRFLDIINLSVEKEGFKTLRIDGRVAPKKRFEAIRQFQQKGGPRVFLISLKAGGTGLNLTRANNIILMDPWWNPSTEDQAIDRVNRIGQTRPVQVTRFIVKDSIEEQILKLHEVKRNVARKVFGGKSNEQLQDLKVVFGVA